MCLQFLFPIILLARLDTPKEWILISIPCQKLQNFLILTLCPAQNYGCLNLHGYQITRSPPLLVQEPGEYSKLQVTGMIKGFSIPGFFGVFKTIWRFVVSTRVLRPPSPINCFYFSCYLIKCFLEIFKVQKFGMRFFGGLIFAPIRSSPSFQLSFEIRSLPARPQEINTFRFQIAPMHDYVRRVNFTNKPRLWTKFFAFALFVRGYSFQLYCLGNSFLWNFAYF